MRNANNIVSFLDMVDNINSPIPGSAACAVCYLNKIRAEAG